ncbi:hypothetical protein CDQ84_15860 [Clostridium thermosuccinogenes]|uniref:Uncharacterized protein n=1 Tax=Clostridium thermosuccinogenes TaxID=84032 RepID=A0A2K2FBD6_9CLOT|nr:PglZ domain-containing protein [Pseudoclostridium thermosuccinogenes]AUS98091.1 hypothetical protein CDO33_17530 [Pseudoclostridium thermosuccinogenes]PNT95189.1 hypothetical protein CDQ85_15720 [Pseudoclostridium thermosuccinogenes]PNT96068.1 hypothetical protein CDQ84_15860 [Pseudoclostridium thermosuccinogenes]
MKTPFYKLIQADINEKFKNSNIVIWYDCKNEFLQEFNLYDEQGVNKIAFEGSFIELRYKILLADSELSKKWLIYSNVENRQGFLTEFEFFGDTYIASVKDILERYYRIDFGQFDISTLEERLHILKRLWDIIPENVIRSLSQETLDDIVLTNGFGYVDISKEYTILKYICETDKYDSILEEAKIKDKFFEFLSLEYGINVSDFNSKDKIAKYIAESLFQSELIQKSRNKDIRPFGIELNTNKIMNCVQLLETWANHDIYREKFIEYSKRVSEKYMINVLNEMELDELFAIEYLYGIEEILYKKLEIQIFKDVHDSYLIKESLLEYLSGQYVKEEKKNYQYSDIEKGIDIESLKTQLKDLSVFIDIRRRYYFSKSRIFNKWNILNNIFQLINMLYKFEEEFKTITSNMDNIISLYETNNWWKIDLLYRKVQEDYTLIDDFISRLLNFVNKKYYYQYLKPLNEEISNIIENRHNYEFKTDIQLDFWSKYVSNSNKKTAVIIVDAMRYEMGKEMFSMLNEIENKTIVPLIASIPTVTEFGMASLLPNGNTKLIINEENDTIKIMDGNFNYPLNNKSERIRFFLEISCGNGVVKKLNEIIDIPMNSLKGEFENKDRILIFSNEIDEAGHIEDCSIQMFPGLLNKINSAIKKLVQIDIEKIVVVADHGFILTSGLEEWMKVDIPKDLDNIVKKRRYTISRNRVEGNYISKSAYSVNYNGDLYFNFPRGINVFPVSGGIKFHHGGISLQELLVPVIVIEKKDEKVIEVYNPEVIEQISLVDIGLDIDFTQNKVKDIPISVKEQIKDYIDKSNLNKKEKKVLELFLKASSYTDSEIQEICKEDGIKFVSQSVMAFMQEFISKLNKEGYDWIGFKVVGMSTYEYYLK